MVGYVGGKSWGQARRVAALHPHPDSLPRPRHRSRLCLSRRAMRREMAAGVFCVSLG